MRVIKKRRREIKSINCFMTCFTIRTKKKNIADTQKNRLRRRLI